MKELINVFKHLMDQNILDYIIEIKQHFEIENKKDEKLILKVLDYYSQTFNLIKNVEELLHFINLYHLTVSKFSENLHKIEKDMKECGEIPISEYHSNLQTNNIDNYLSNEEPIRLLTLLNEILESYEFFIDKEEDDLRNLIEFVDDIGDSFIKPDTIKNCIKVLDF